MCKIIGTNSSQEREKKWNSVEFSALELAFVRVNEKKKWPISLHVHGKWYLRIECALESDEN